MYDRNRLRDIASKLREMGRRAQRADRPGLASDLYTAATVVSQRGSSLPHWAERALERWQIEECGLHPDEAGGASDWTLVRANTGDLVIAEGANTGDLFYLTRGDGGLVTITVYDLPSSRVVLGGHGDTFVPYRSRS